MSTILSKERTKNYIKQSIMSFVFKGLAILANFLSIPLMIKYLGIKQYGVWSTLLSIVSWVVLFDLGIGNGLKNKITESLAQDDKKKVLNYISTAYIIIGAISLMLILFFLIVSEYIPWQRVFNIKSISNQYLQSVVNITVIFLFLNFWISLINQVFNGFQKTSLVVFNQLLSSIFSLLTVFVLYHFFESSLEKLAFFYGISLLSSSFILSFWFYKNNKEIIPKVKFFGLSYAKLITSLGFKFFVIQIAVIVIFTTDKILITQLFGPQYVANYDVVFKLFSVITIAHGILMAPLWSAYSDAYHRGDMVWIKQTIKNQLKIYFLIIVATILLIFLAKPIISFWIGKNFVVDNMLIIAMALFILLSTWNNIFGCILGGLGYVRLGAYYTSITAILNIPISYYFAITLDFGISGIVYGTVFSICVSSIISPIQVYYFVYSNNKNKLYSRILK